MNAREAIKLNLQMADYVGLGYVEDLADGDLMRRACPGINHIKWQVGHLITSENKMISDCIPGSMPPLPPDFGTKYAKDKATIDDPAQFHSKQDLITAHKQQRAATIAALDKLSDADLDKPAPEAHRGYAPTVGSLFSLQGSHWLMHCGQWAVVRRQLGKPPMF